MALAFVCIGTPFLIPTMVYGSSEIAARRRGAMLTYDLATGVVHLPRLGISVERANLIRFDLIRGSRTRPSHRLKNPAMELHLMIRRRSGRIISVPIIGTGVGRKIRDVADTVGSAVQIPILWHHDTTDYGKLAIAHAKQECVTCGYSLRGNTSGVCPECGTPTPAGRVDPPIT